VPLWTRIIKIPWGQVELRPAEKTAEDLFNKFGNHPWVGGDPWTFQKDMFASAAKKSSNLSYHLIGILNTTQLLLSDICISNQSCELYSSLLAPGGIYHVFAIMNGSRYAGRWVELEMENSTSNMG